MYQVTTCEKLFENFPFAHRQPNHKGHCRLIHGHNWSFRFVLKATQLDENDFVVDFGELKWLRKWLEIHFDHTLVLNDSDPFLPHLRECLEEFPLDPSAPDTVDFARIVEVPNCGAEGLARWVLESVNRILQFGIRQEELGIDWDLPEDWVSRGVSVCSVTVFEDTKNSATYHL